MASQTNYQHINQHTIISSIPHGPSHKNPHPVVVGSQDEVVQFAKSSSHVQSQLQSGSFLAFISFDFTLALLFQLNST